MNNMCRIICIKRYKNNTITIDRNYNSSVYSYDTGKDYIYLSSVINNILKLERIKNKEHITFVIRACRYIDPRTGPKFNALMRSKSDNSDREATESDE